MQRCIDREDIALRQEFERDEPNGKTTEREPYLRDKVFQIGDSANPNFLSGG